MHVELTTISELVDHDDSQAYEIFVVLSVDSYVKIYVLISNRSCDTSISDHKVSLLTTSRLRNSVTRHTFVLLF